MSSQSGFWFPSMKISEITHTLEEWGLRISDEQIQRPTAETVMQIHLLFLQLLTRISPEMLEAPATKASMVIEDHTELYTNGLNMSLVLYHVQQIAHNARSHDFSIRDLVYPEPERTRNILSAIINLIKFAEERDGFVKKLREQSVSAQLEREQTVQRIDELKEKIAEIKAQRQADEPRCAALREETAQVSKAISVLKNNHDALTKEINKYKRDKSALTQQKENILQEVSLVSAAVNSTRSRIVQSPDRIKKHISEMGRLAQDERIVIAGNETKTRDLKVKLDALNGFEQDMKKLNDDLRAIQAEQIQIENISEKLAEYRSELDRKKIYREQLLGRVDRAKRQLRNAEERLTRQQQLGEDRWKRFEEENARLRKEYEEMSEERREHDKQVEEMKEAASEIERKMSEHLKKNEVELNELLAEYWAVRNDAEIYMETLANKFGISVS